MNLGVGAVVTSCPGCYLQLQASLDMPVYFFSDIFLNREEKGREREEKGKKK